MIFDYYYYSKQMMEGIMKLIAQSIIILFLALLIAPTGFAEDVAGSSDHPMVSRYDGSSITEYDFREFDEYEILLGKAKRDTEDPGKIVAETSENLEGKVTMISYYLPDDRSTLEVFRNYEDALKAAGFEVIFTCSNNDCGGRDFNHKVVEYTGGIADNYSDQRFLADTLTRAEGDVYVSNYTVKNTGCGWQDRNNTTTKVDMV